MSYQEFNEQELRGKILELTREYSQRCHRQHRPNGEGNKEPFIPGVSQIPYAARTFTEDEVVAAVDSTLDFWLTLGPEGKAMEGELSRFLGVRKSLLVNSGSSANLIALNTVTSPLIEAERRIRPGDEVITCAAGFPTTVSPIVQTGCVPVFLDNDPVTGNICTELLEEAFVNGKTKAVMVAHALGNPFKIAEILNFCKKHQIWMIEDNCDALGSSYSMPKDIAKKNGIQENSPGITPLTDYINRWTGTLGDLSSQSFYPPHHITMGEGGAVNIVHSIKLRRPAESFRDWGRDCWCESGKDNTCGKRFSWELGELPLGYDHKYTYSHIGYNLKPLDIQAAIGRVQLKKLPKFVEARKTNWEILRKGLDELGNFFEFTLPTHATSWTSKGFTWDSSNCKTDCSWFGFMLRIRDDAPFTTEDLARYLDNKKIGTRKLFGGNLLRQPAFLQLRKDYPNKLRIVGNLEGADELMNQALFLGTYPGLSESMLEYEIEIINDYVNKF